MNELQMKVFSPKQLSQLKEVKPDEKWQGFFYVVEYGNFVKIGSSINPYNRYITLKKQAQYGQQKMGQIAISCSHTNFRQNEYKLHTYYSEARIEGTELFRLPFNRIIKECWEIPEYVFDDDTDYEGTEKIKILLHSLWESEEKIEKRKFALLTALIANCPLIVTGNQDELEIIDDLKTASALNKQVEKCLIELGLLLSVPFIKECRLSIKKPNNVSLKEKAIKVGTEIVKRHVEIPLDMVMVMEEGGIYDFS